MTLPRVAPTTDFRPIRFAGGVLRGLRTLRTVTHSPSSASTKAEVKKVVMQLAATRGYDGASPTDDEPLTELGFDSLLTIELVARLEDHFDIRIPDEHLVPTSFATVASICALIDQVQ
jgi:acyl carrier protein